MPPQTPTDHPQGLQAIIHSQTQQLQEDLPASLQLHATQTGTFFQS